MFFFCYGNKFQEYFRWNVKPFAYLSIVKHSRKVLLCIYHPIHKTQSYSLFLRLIASLASTRSEINIKLIANWGQINKEMTNCLHFKMWMFSKLFIFKYRFMAAVQKKNEELTLINNDTLQDSSRTSDHHGFKETSRILMESEFVHGEGRLMSWVIFHARKELGH